MNTASPESVRAVEHYLRELYQSTRAIAAAYAVDTGDLDPIAAPTWDVLTPAQKNAWLDHIHPLVPMITHAFVATLNAGGEQP
jgi:hypothetical protein